MLSQKNYLNQVALIQSECQPRKKAAHIPAVVFNRSPLRDRQSNYIKNVDKINLANLNHNSNNGGNSNNTPGRVGKVSLSPLRSRKCDTSISVKSTLKKKVDVDCTNHPTKIARYLVESEEECLFYCEKCAILLASQGFKVCKINDQAQNNHRKRQIEQFVGELESVANSLVKRQNFVDGVILSGNNSYQQQLDKIQDYYTQFYDIIDQHKRRVLQQVKIEYDNAKHQAEALKKSYEEAINQSNSMKEDINASMNSIIMEAEEAQYRPVMDLYKDKVRKFRAVLSRQVDDLSIQVRKVCFKDGEQLCQIIADGLGIQWEDQKVRYIEQSLQSEARNRQVNPVQCLQSEEKFAKSSLKDLGGLFCSFDQ